MEFKFRGKRIDTGEWIYGDLIKNSSLDPFTYIQIGMGYKFNNTNLKKPIKVYPHTVGLSTGRNDMAGNKLYQHDIIRSYNGELLSICFGTYKAYCPEDKKEMDSVGFYAHHDSYKDMPLGPTEDYAVLVGNIHTEK
ncbi:MAG: hypothetical protein ACOYOV_09035 [Bacteroidales bacterium]